MTRDEISSQAQRWREAGETVVFTNGCFDILHVGHIQTLTRAASEGTKLVVGVNSDSSVQRLKGPTRPVNPEQDRAGLLAALRCVDAVVIFEEDTPVELLEVLRPHVHVKGGDYKVEDLPEKDAVEKHGGRIVIIDLVPGRSTTNLIQKTQGL
ncbi:MAG: D-glycero-beta-D-manno-heptose 1-phosphate adenylyltransferase [Candidatus Eremiobacteraeota bacterium]|nr:D-glycero-beta-D-manno-heptose 1-phosphate adenylyltransferase [Candidatus Eremiobacteraeota bacterium]